MMSDKAKQFEGERLKWSRRGLCEREATVVAVIPNCCRDT